MKTKPHNTHIEFHTGDVVEVEIGGIGRLGNPVRAEA